MDETSQLEMYLKDFLKDMKIDEAYKFAREVGLSPITRFERMAGLSNKHSKFTVILEECYGQQVQIAPGAWTTTRVVDVKSIRVEENR